MSMCLQLVSIQPSDMENLLIGDALEDLLDAHFEAQSDHALDIDKNWDAVDFLFNQADRSSFSRNWLTEAGDPMGEDLGYGPARVWSRALVQTFAAKISVINADALNAFFDFQVMARAEVYPDMWDMQNPEDRNIALSACSDLQRLLTATAKRNDMLLAALL